MTPVAGQNPGATNIPLPLRVGDKNGKLNDRVVKQLYIKKVCSGHIFKKLDITYCNNFSSRLVNLIHVLLFD